MKLKLSKSILARMVPALILFFPGLAKLQGFGEISSALLDLGLDSKGQSALGLVEISGAFLLLWRKFAVIGALIASFVLSGAIGAHYNQLGFSGEMGALFLVAMIGLILSIAIAWSLRKEIPIFGRLL